MERSGAIREAITPSDRHDRGFLAVAASLGCRVAPVVPVSADGIQRAEIGVDSYSFSPSRLIVKENVPVELIIKSTSWIVPHNFVLKSPEAGLEIEKETPPRETVTLRLRRRAPECSDFSAPRSFSSWKVMRTRGWSAR